MQMVFCGYLDLWTVLCLSYDTKVLCCYLLVFYGVGELDFCILSK
jgi:hypothetical protein